MQLTLWLNVNVLRVLLLGELLHAENAAVVVQVKEHVRILITPQPLVLPVKPEWLRRTKQAPHVVFVFQVPAVHIPLGIASVVEALRLFIFFNRLGKWRSLHERLVRLLLALTLRQGRHSLIDLA